jgi:antitoxin ParD1/3/4
MQDREDRMATLNVSLPDPLEAWVEDRVKRGSYVDAGDYVRDLIRRDRDERQALVDALIEGEQSGISDRSVSEIIADARTRFERGEL